MTSPVTYVTNGIQDFVKYVKSWVHLDLRPDIMLFGRLQSVCLWAVPTEWPLLVLDILSLSRP